MEIGRKGGSLSAIFYDVFKNSVGTGGQVVDVYKYDSSDAMDKLISSRFPTLHKNCNLLPSSLN